MAYTTIEEVAAGFRTLSSAEQAKCAALLVEADVLIDRVAKNATDMQKNVAERRMVRRALGDGSDVDQYPIGATQGSVSALGYSQSWTMNNGSTGELYIGKSEKTILGIGNQIGMSNPYAEDE